jgi:hypothetical protein
MASTIHFKKLNCYENLNSTPVLSIDRNDGLVKSQETPFSVIPAEAGIQEYRGLLDPGFRRGDGLEDFLRTHQEK